MNALGPLILGVLSGLIAGILIGNAVAFPTCMLLSISLFAIALLIIILIEFLPGWVTAAAGVLVRCLRKPKATDQQESR